MCSFQRHARLGFSSSGVSCSYSDTLITGVGAIAGIKSVEKGAEWKILRASWQDKLGSECLQ